ncbi:sensor histidine kinase [Nocardioides houyundeii]|uniref:sensor histidine kinase n=1 Tax=Nocardioides houyundeii TaxID=2045452 RepID=UPI000DF28D77|nr:histidine kinase [Nocardioides houyundeii]
MTGVTRDWRSWAPDLAVGLVVLLVGLVEATGTDLVYSSRTSLALVALGMAAAAGLSRRAPGIALLLVWAVCGIQLLGSVDLMVSEVAVAVVAFGTARWGSLLTVWLSALSIPAAGLVVFVLLAVSQLSGLVEQAGVMTLVERAYSYGDTWQLAAALIGVSVLGIPWLAGLALRFMSRARRSEISQVAAEEDAAQAHRESEQAREIAQLREEQARMARDVHDVVGHSLAVILAQAESAQYRKGSDTEALKETMATIATSARTSLQDVRQVLTTTAQPTVRLGGLDSLVDGVRASGHQVLSTEEGTPQPLPPDLETVAYRVLQEMLTNAIRHGRRDSAVHVERHWEGELRIEVRNVVDTSEDLTAPIAAVDVARMTSQPRSGGRGVEGMRRRLEAAGGRLDVRRRQEESGPTFTATAWLPLRSVAS